MAEAFIKYAEGIETKLLPLYPTPEDKWQSEYGQTDLLKEHYVSLEEAKSFKPTDILIFWAPETINQIAGIFGRKDCRYISFALHEWTIFSKEFKQALDSFDFCAVPSSWSKETYIKNGVPEDKIFILPCGISDEFLKSEGHKRNPDTTEHTNFIFVGKIEERKAFDELILTFNKASKNTNSHLKLLTFSQTKDTDIRNYVKQLVPDNNNIFPFFARIDTEEKMRAIYEHSDYLLLPSRSGAVELPMLEAMTCGCLPICTNFSGMSYYLPEDYKFKILVKELVPIYDPIYFPNKGEKGHWAEPDWTDLAQMIDYANEIPRSFYNDLSVHVYKHVRDNFSWSNIIPSFLKAIN
ncbi:MAG: glycosyltransferase family 4 protein [Nitrosotalea sp.]